MRVPTIVLAGRKASRRRRLLIAGIALRCVMWCVETSSTSRRPQICWRESCRPHPQPRSYCNVGSCTSAWFSMHDSIVFPFAGSGLGSKWRRPRPKTPTHNRLCPSCHVRFGRCHARARSSVSVRCHNVHPAPCLFSACNPKTLDKPTRPMVAWHRGA